MRAVRLDDGRTMTIIIIDLMKGKFLSFHFLHRKYIPIYLNSNFTSLHIVLDSLLCASQNEYQIDDFDHIDKIKWVNPGLLFFLFQIFYFEFGMDLLNPH